MILRKPYAFFIKHFRLIHLILACLMTYSLYRTKLVLDFFNQYASTTMSVVGQELVDTYLYGLILIMPLLIIIVTALIMAIMGYKKKPTTFYIINIIIFVYALIILLVTKSTLIELQKVMVDVRRTRLIRDLITISFFTQIVSALIVFVRATGFNIKKFDFKRDLKELNIEEQDSEEFELDISIDRNKTRRGIRRRLRHLKYAYKENKLFVFVSTGVIILAIFISTYLGLSIKQDILKENNTFSGNGFTLSIMDSYLTYKDYKGNIIDKDNYYLIVRLKIKANGSSSTLDLATTKVLIDQFSYIPTVEKKDILFNYGNIYNTEKISTEYEIKSFIYQIPKQLIGSDMIFSYVIKDKVGSNKYDDIKVKINYADLTLDNDLETFNLGDKVSFTSVLNNYSLNIDNYELASQYKVDYNYTISNDTYPSYEYIVPSITSNYEKSILKLNGNLTIGDVNLTGINDLYDFVDSFGKLQYVIDDKTYTQNVKFLEINPKKTKKTDTYYIEVLSEVSRASKVSIIFKVNNRNFEYILK